jgi:hypothetical protein
MCERFWCPSFDESAADASRYLYAVVAGLSVNPAAELVLHLLPYLPEPVLERLQRAWGPERAEKFRPGTYTIRRRDDEA